MRMLDVANLSNCKEAAHPGRIWRYDRHLRMVQHVVSGLCLGVANTTRMQLYACNSHSFRQRWTLLNEKGAFFAHDQHKRNSIDALRSHIACEYEFDGCSLDRWRVRSEEVIGASNNSARLAAIQSAVAQLHVTEQLAVRQLPHNVYHEHNYPVRACDEDNVRAFNEYVKQHPEPNLAGDLIAVKRLSEHVNTTWKQSATAAVHQMIRAFQVAQVPLVLAAGTHLGWFRQCDIILYTTDVDFYVPFDYILSTAHFELLAVCVRRCATSLTFHRTR